MSIERTIEEADRVAILLLHSVMEDETLKWFKMRNPSFDWSEKAYFDDDAKWDLFYLDVSDETFPIPFSRLPSYLIDSDSLPPEFELSFRSETRRQLENVSSNLGAMFLSGNKSEIGNLFFPSRKGSFTYFGSQFGLSFV